MALQRAGTLYPKNSTTVDTGTGIDVRLLGSSQGGTNETQTATATNANDNVERTFDPATTGVTNTNNAATTLFRTGWALRLSEDMTPPDDANCDAYLPAGTVTVSASVAVAWTSTPVGNNPAPIWRASLWRYDVSTNAGVLIAGASSDGSVNWTLLPSQSGTTKTVTWDISVGSNATFSANEVLLLQVGVNTATLPNPLLGTANFTLTLFTDTLNTSIAHSAGSTILQACTLSLDTVGAGVPTRGALLGELSRSATGDGVPTFTKAANINKSFDLAGDGVPDYTKTTQVVRSFSLTGDGVTDYAKQVAAVRSFDVAGDGTVTHSKAAALSHDAVGDGVPTGAKAVTASKSFSLTGDGVPTVARDVALSRSVAGDGVPTGAKAVVAAKSFDLVGVGELSRAYDIALVRSAFGDGVVDAAKAANINKSFDLTGDAVVTEAHPVQAFRTFNLTGAGEVLTSGANGSTITVPLDELPTPDVTPDYPVTNPTKQIAGNVIHHETGDPIEGATLRLFREADDMRVQIATSGPGGAYSFVRDQDDPNSYYVIAEYNDAGTQVHGVTDRGLIPELI